jgi:hypothetical protein
MIIIRLQVAPGVSFAYFTPIDMFYGELGHESLPDPFFEAMDAIVAAQPESLRAARLTSHDHNCRISAW